MGLAGAFAVAGRVGLAVAGRIGFLDTSPAMVLSTVELLPILLQTGRADAGRRAAALFMMVTTSSHDQK